MTTEENLITKVCTTIFAMSMTLSVMAIDNNKVVRTQKFDAQSIIEMQKMQQEKQEVSAAAKMRVGARPSSYVAPRVSALVKLHKGIEASSLSGMGFEVTPLCNNFGVVTLSADSLETLAEVEDIERISFGERKMELMLNKANETTGVDLIHAGSAANDLEYRDFSGLNRSFTGKGTMIGIFDSGFDPNHAMFLDENGVSRFKMIGTATTDMTEDPQSIASFTTDYKFSTHATHVSGIAAGNFQGDGFQLQGVATGAELAFGPIMSEPSELTRLVAIAEYCKAHNLRLVTNMSYGSAFGPHDGSDIYAQAFDELINKYDIVACISAGNYADKLIVEKHSFNGEENDVMKGLYDLDYSNNQIKNYLVTADASPIDIDLVVMDYLTQEVVKSYRIVEQSEVQNIAWGDDFIMNNVNIAQETIHDGLNGYIIECPSIKLGSYKYRIGYIIKGQEGQMVTSYTDSNCPFLDYFEDWAKDITPNGTMCDLTCAKEVIAVGAYNTTPSMKLANGKYKTITNSNYDNWGVNEGDITYYSSFGTRYDGVELPHICAPGAYLESSYNRYYTLSSGKKTITRTDTYDGKSYSFCAMNGTSMSSPYMAGVAALWLEANPELTHNEIKMIAMLTATSDYACNEGNYFKGEGYQAGAGKLNAYAGLMYILNENDATTRIETPEEKSFLVRNTSATDYEAFCAGATSLTATLYNMEGKKVNSTAASGNIVSISTAGLTKGIYILKVNSNNKSHQMKIAVR